MSPTVTPRLLVLAEPRMWLKRFLTHLRLQPHWQVVHWTWQHWLHHTHQRLYLLPKAEVDVWQDEQGLVNFTRDTWLFWGELSALWPTLEKYTALHHREYLYQSYLSAYLLRSYFSPSVYNQRPEHLSPGFHLLRGSILLAQEDGVLHKTGHVRSRIINDALFTKPLEHWLVIHGRAYAWHHGWSACDLPDTWHAWLERCEIWSGCRWLMLTWRYQTNRKRHSLNRIQMEIDWPRSAQHDQMGFQYLTDDLTCMMQEAILALQR